MPYPFYLSCIAILVVGWFAWQGRRQAWGLPACMVLGTVSVWYVGDVLYNEIDVYFTTIGAASVTSAWWQVLLFVTGFGAMVYPLHQWINGGLPNQRSHVIAYLETDRLRRPDVQRRINLLVPGLLVVWIILMSIAVVQVRGDVIGLFAPYLGQKANPWSRGQIGGGFSALISFAAYLQIFLAAAFGVLAAVSFNRKTQGIAILVCCLTLPYFIFDRTRNTMLATVLPGVLAYIFLRLRGGLVAKGFGLLGFFFGVNFWFTVVMANRSGMAFDISGALSGNSAVEETRHEGLNMLEELAWVDNFLTSGAYRPNWGERYFAELVNPVPRAFWENKPMIGLDYAVARGQSVSGPGGETTATMSTGMIGQGVVNFGRLFGPLAAAFLMSLWVAVLARQDLLGSSPARMILYSCGLILTFNLGRDITLLVLYPFVFGLGLLILWNLYPGKKEGVSKKRPGGRAVRMRRARPGEQGIEP